MSTVQVVGDAYSEMQRVMKGKDVDAEWVIGLEDEATQELIIQKFDLQRQKMARKQAKRIARGLGGENGLKVPEDAADVSSDDESTFAGMTRFKQFNKGGVGNDSKDATVEQLLGYVNKAVETFVSMKTAWLRVPFGLLFFATILSLLQHFVTYQNNQGFNHPPNEVSLWKYCRFDTAYSVLVDGPFLSFNLVHILGALAAVSLCYKLGGATQNFMAFCGVGFGVLSLVATLLDGILAVRACPHGRDLSKGCNYPFGSHWALSAVKNIGATAALCLGASVFDLVQKQMPSSSSEEVTSTRTTTIVTAVPAILYTLFYFLRFYNGIDVGNNTYVVTAGSSGSGSGSGKKGGAAGRSGKSSDPLTVASGEGSPLANNLAYYASLAQCIAWALLVPMLYKQRRLTTVSVPSKNSNATTSFPSVKKADSSNKGAPAKGSPPSAKTPATVAAADPSTPTADTPTTSDGPKITKRQTATIAAAKAAAAKAAADAAAIEASEAKGGKPKKNSKGKKKGE